MIIALFTLQAQYLQLQLLINNILIGYNGMVFVKELAVFWRNSDTGKYI
jgi:hypothetical protein